MCGIFGIVADSDKISCLKGSVGKAVKSLSHRGPDGSAVFNSERAVLAHTRLAIIDLQSGSQPMVSGDGKNIIVFNGEIFNYKSLKQTLTRFGHSFSTNSDTEVALNAYKHFGADCLNYFHGMFAFAIYDLEKKRLFAARDRYGLKPFYYARYNGLFVFGSEARAFYESGLVPFEPKPEHFNEFLIFGYVAGKETLHKHIYELEPGHYLVYADNEIKTVKYYSYPGEKTGFELDNESGIIDELENKIKSSVALWLTADVRIGTLLSGGIDSSLITRLASDYLKDLQTFTVYFPDDPGWDERNFSKKTSDLISSRTTFLKMRNEDAIGRLDEIYSHFNEPLPSNSLTIYNIIKGVRDKSDLKVVLTGDGGDELFGGYERHRVITDEYRNSADLSTIYYAFNRVAIPRLKLFAKDIKISNPARMEALNNLTCKEPLNKVLEFDQKVYLLPFLHSLDRIGMMFGLEVRSPYMEHDLVEFINQLPGNYKIRNGWSKYIQRKVADKFLPKDIVWNHKKTPITAPMISRLFFNEKFSEIFTELITNNSKIKPYYDVDGMLKLLKMHNPHLEGQDHSNTLFRVLSLELWLNSAA